jgi:hypothetical protein
LFVVGCNKNSSGSSGSDQYQAKGLIVSLCIGWKNDNGGETQEKI